MAPGRSKLTTWTVSDCDEHAGGEDNRIAIAVTPMTVTASSVAAIDSPRVRTPEFCHALVGGACIAQERHIHRRPRRGRCKNPAVNRASGGPGEPVADRSTRDELTGL